MKGWVVKIPSTDWSGRQSFPIACTISSDPLKNTLIIRLQPVELDCRSEELLDILEFDFDGSLEELWCFEPDGNAEEGLVVVSFVLLLEEL